jgi:mono/diheme cytochrome c family protein
MNARRTYAFLVAALAALPLAAGMYAQSEKAGAAEVQAPAYLIESLEGRDLFRAYCATCHGMDARGGGPSAAGLKTAPPDLTQIAGRRGGVFPLAGVEKIIAGEATSATHGMREMPVWGPILGQIQQDQSLGKVRIRNLAKYLESLQQAPRGIK